MITAGRSIAIPLAAAIILGGFGLNASLGQTPWPVLRSGYQPIAAPIYHPSPNWPGPSSPFQPLTVPRVITYYPYSPPAAPITTYYAPPSQPCATCGPSTVLSQAIPTATVNSYYPPTASNLYKLAQPPVRLPAKTTTRELVTGSDYSGSDTDNYTFINSPEGLLVFDGNESEKKLYRLERGQAGLEWKEIDLPRAKR